MASQMDHGEGSWRAKWTMAKDQLEWTIAMGQLEWTIWRMDRTEGTMVIGVAWHHCLSRNALKERSTQTKVGRRTLLDALTDLAVNVAPVA